MFKVDVKDTRATLLTSLNHSKRGIQSIVLSFVMLYFFQSLSELRKFILEQDVGNKPKGREDLNA